ncbi:MAG TPA: sigma 54-interacting transcriptional regulator [Acidobacteriota bacterium]|nr:sigma 54-interacting transcriptional regulator [Acidobacteriota bacterium]HNT18049.1 sigma 54-interacting transcriptional regulator [Acidobacteriota bacterium]HPA27088.1 sigma 54-interacting transcriptional regulator [Acidobacteriota bacterium]HQO18957.1 sigma 54-interacting transcriptional regulator [Acidobacteriota bacterium]HQQ46383.1 sigma 54-interacting transcriptional regulator [Acidobacteriota bacterium]
MEPDAKKIIEECKYQRILDGVNDGIIVISLDRRIIFINETGRKLLKYEEGEVLQARCKSVTQTSRCGENCPLTHAIDSNEDQRNLEMWYTTKDGNQLLCRTNVLLLRDADGQVAGGVEIFNDVTAMRALQDEAESQHQFSSIVGKSGPMEEVFDQIRMVARTHSTVLITGESGTGKELVANAIHYNSLRKEHPLVKVSCAALNEGVLESELFGHVRGAFTGANWDKVGRFEYADGGTVFLDEVGEIPLSVQVKLLRVLQEGEIERVGSSKTVKVNVRLIAATNRNLEDAVKQGQFRNDLYYRLNVFRIPLPPLRDRKKDIPLLVDNFIRKIAVKMPQKDLKGIEAEALSRLMSYDYPGNIRELENIVEHAAIRARTEFIRLLDLPITPEVPQLESPLRLHQIQVPIQTLERDLIVRALEATKWRISKAAGRLGVSRVTLWRKMKDYGIQRGDE